MIFLYSKISPSGYINSVNNILYRHVQMSNDDKCAFVPSLSPFIIMITLYVQK